ncbi:MAG: hypothetical protein IJ447_07630 [Clostridia bacterium]|nr:hypothetical protein [Clostridia bacterium]
MTSTIEYKCPSCGGAIEFDPTVQKMKCPYCDSEFEMEVLKKLDEEEKNKQPDKMDWETKAGGEWQDGEADSIKVYTCKSCGGEIVADDTTSATSCPYCDNPVVISGQVSGELKPDFVIPFKVTKEQAKEALKKHISGKKFIPKTFKEENHLDEIKGIYVPFWLFDANARAHINYKATKVRHWSDTKYNYTNVSTYRVRRGGCVGFEHVPVDGSSKMADELMESIEPFDFKDAVDFQTAYLAGYLADKYDVTPENSIERANERIKTSTEQLFASTVTGYNSVITENSSVQLENGTAKYALYPVWLLNTTWQGQKYTFAMNGQTGKFVGDLPVDKKSFWTNVLGWGAGISAVVYGIAWLFTQL